MTHRRLLRRLFLTFACVALFVPRGLARDTYPRQPIDIEHYHFGVTLSDANDRVVGDTTVRARMLANGTTSIALDLANATPARAGKGMTVESVAIAGKPAPFTHQNDRLSITLPSASREGQIVEARVKYSGIPADGLQIKPNPHGDRTFFTDDWPTKARHWLPVVDHIGDKATMEMDVAAPSHYQVISNGLRVESTDLPSAMRRTVWRQSVPIAPWLYTLGVAEFAVQRVGDYNGVPIETWVFAKDRDKGFYDFAVPTKEVLAFYSEWVGPYAYEKLANVQSNSVSGGMESASSIFYSASSVVGDRNVRWRNVVIHEIAHQWFGNAVTERDWNDVWLSEGFATYFTSLFIEHAYGRDEFVDTLRKSRQTVLDFDTKTPNYRVVHENLDDMSKVTTSMTYQKGGWTLHMLRQRMGDDRFWSGIRAYYRSHMNGTSSTTEFRQAMEAAAGESLTAFFDQWLYRGGVPRVSGTWSWDAAAKTVTVDLAQTQTGAPFSIPVEIGLQMPNGAVRVERIEMTSASAHAVFNVANEPSSVVIDPAVKLLAAATIVKK